MRFRRTIRVDESLNVIDGMVKAHQLYKELSALAHPDRNPDKIEVAEDLMKRIVANKYNYAALISIKGEIIKKLL